MSAQTSTNLGADYVSQADFIQNTFDTSRMLMENAEAQRAAVLASIGDNIRHIDHMLARAHAVDVQEELEIARVITKLQEVRAAAVALIADRVPDEAYFWSPEMQARIRQSEADVAAGRSHIFLNEADMDTFFQEQGAHV